MLRSRVRLSTLCLVTLGLFDLVTTLLLMQRGYGEGNPLFAWLASHGTLAFAGGKVILLAGPIVILEFVRLRNSSLAEKGTWVAFVAYALLYSTQLIRLRS